jgi:predicted phosphodiesterase
MNILVLSDLHIDTGDSFGTFQWNENDFISQIEKMKYLYSPDKIIFNGDTFELLKYRYEDIVNANKTLIEYLRNKDFVFIKGNHDLLYDSAVNEYEITNSSGQTIHIEHGHNADWFDGSKLGRAVSKLGFSLLKKLSDYKFLMDIYFKIVAFGDQINHIPKKYNTLKYLTYALKLLKEHDVVILSHTHKLESHHTYYLNKKKRYLNTGSCSMGRFQGIVMDTETLRYDLIKEAKGSLENVYRMRSAI